MQCVYEKGLLIKTIHDMPCIIQLQTIPPSQKIHHFVYFEYFSRMKDNKDDNIHSCKITMTKLKETRNMSLINTNVFKENR